MTPSLLIEKGIAKKLPELLKDYSERRVIITDSSVAKYYGKALQKLICSELIIFPEGEKQKTRTTKAWVEDQMFQKQLGRDSVIIALGGGVVTDLAGFVAATYCRGIPYFSIPTTLVGMVDAAIGGKTGVNTPYGKNLVGAFYLPEQIVIDSDFLDTLPKEGWLNGLAEIIKHGLIHDLAYFERVEKGDFTKDIDTIIKRSVEIKQEIVSQDQKESGMRRILNFGHTIAHAIEVLSDYTIPHGQAVAIGCVSESLLSHLEGYLSYNEYKRIKNIFEKLGFNLKIPSSFQKKELLQAMKSDKKALKGNSRFVLLHSIGSVHSFNQEYCKEVKGELLIKLLQKILL